MPTIPPPTLRADLPEAEAHHVVEQPDPAKVAVVLNRNARQVSDGLARRIERVVGTDHVFYSRNLDEAEAFAREIVQKGFGTVVSAGGDGTLIQTVRFIQQYIDEANAWRTQRHRDDEDALKLIGTPRFGFLRLGTGNGLAPVVGARNALADLKRLVRYAPKPTLRVPLIRSGEDQFLFGGAGFDAMVLDDFTALRDRQKTRLGRAVFASLFGYLAASFLRTLPRLLSHDHQFQARVVTNSPAFYINPKRGDWIEELPAGSVLYEGPATNVIAGTTPFFGYRFRAFPFARMYGDRFQLRVGTISPWGVLRHLPSIWRGSYRHPEHFFDFLVDDVSVTLDRVFPFQHSGDPREPRDAFDLKLSDKALDLVDFRAQRKTRP